MMSYSGENALGYDSIANQAIEAQRIDAKIRAAQMQVAPQQPRTFSLLQNALESVTSSQVRVDRMLDRISPRDKVMADEVSCYNTARELSYLELMERLQVALGDLGSSLSELEKHI